MCHGVPPPPTQTANNAPRNRRTRAGWVSHTVTRPRALAGSLGLGRGSGGSREVGRMAGRWAGGRHAWLAAVPTTSFTPRPLSPPVSTLMTSAVPLRAHLARRDTGRGTAAVTVSQGISVSYLHLQGGQWLGRGCAGCFYLLTCLVIHVQWLLPAGHLFPPKQCGF